MQPILGEVATQWTQEWIQADGRDAGLNDRIADVARHVRRVDMRRFARDAHDGIGDDAMKWMVDR